MEKGQHNSDQKYEWAWRLSLADPKSTKLITKFSHSPYVRLNGNEYTNEIMSKSYVAGLTPCIESVSGESFANEPDSDYATHFTREQNCVHIWKNQMDLQNHPASKLARSHILGKHPYTGTFFSLVNFF